jgi:hypothetical protein
MLRSIVNSILKYHADTDELPYMLSHHMGIPTTSQPAEPAVNRCLCHNRSHVISPNHWLTLPRQIAEAPGHGATLGESLTHCKTFPSCTASEDQPYQARNDPDQKHRHLVNVNGPSHGCCHNAELVHKHNVLGGLSATRHTTGRSLPIVPFSH